MNIFGCLINMFAARALLWVLIVAFTAACLPGRAEAAPEARSGTASWYGTSAHGKKTASGEAFNRYALTCAHKTLPFGTVLRIFNLSNRRQVLVQVNDRGPVSPKRMIDVSYRAAEALRMLRSGLTKVTVEVVGDSTGKPLDGDSAFYVQLSEAETLKQAHLKAAEFSRTASAGLRIFFSVEGRRPAYTVCAGPFSEFSAAHAAFLRLDKARSVYGIVLAPRRAGVIPRHVPPVSAEKTTIPAVTKASEKFLPKANFSEGTGLP